MRIHAIGLGGAGGRIVDRLAADHDGDRFLQGVNAFDTDAAALDALSSLDESRRYRFGVRGWRRRPRRRPPCRPPARRRPRERA